MKFLDIRRLRKDYGLTQSQFAQRMGISQASVSNLETGKQQSTQYFIGIVVSELEIKNITDYIIETEYYNT